MVRGAPYIFYPSLNYSTASSRKMALPVDPSALIYSHFEHVSGIAAPKGTDGVAISRLNLLDVLIGQLNKLKKGSVTQAVINQATKPGRQGNVDALIENFRNQIKQAGAASAAMPYKPSPGAQGGAIFSILS